MSKEFPQFSENEEPKPEVPAKPKRGVVRSGGKTSAALKKKEGGKKEGQEEILMAPVAEARVEHAGGKEPKVVLDEPEWTESVPESVGGVLSEGEGGNKRKRRRRKGKGGGGAASAGEVVAEGAVAVPSSSAPQQSTSRQRVDPGALAKAAWKIYLAEISEEGVSLVGDQDARELARRCFRLAEIFLDESGRRGGGV